MSHDPLCPWSQPCPGSYEGKPHDFIPLDSPDLPPACYKCSSTECQCNLIARVREDMLRWPKVAEVYMKGRDAGYKRGYEDATSQYRSLFELSQIKKTIIDSREVEYRRV